MIRHHPSEDLLLAHFQGRLTEGPSLAMEVHLERCAHCRNEMKLLSLVGGALLENADGVGLSDDAIELAMARIERPYEPAPPQSAVKAKPFLQGFDLPESLTKRVISRYWVGPGVWIAPVATPSAPKKSKTYLLSVAPGMVMPEHGHGGAEMTMVLAGGFSDAAGDYDGGDFIEKAAEDVHAPASDPTEGCLCLITHELPIRPLTLLGKLLKPLARI